MNRIYVTETVGKVGETVTVAGWVHRIRDHSKVLFIDLRDRTGLLQVVSGGWAGESYEVLKSAGTEDVVEITGTVAARPEKLVNPELETGTVELQATEVRILNKSQVTPFAVNEDTADVEEELRLKYRYLDMRTSRVRNNLVDRARIVSFLRNRLEKEHFIEVETPHLSATTPEGARDYLVPTRHKGMFFALPQSPQQYKQLLMVGGIERYYQIARCFRDEDGRRDRQPEFTQLDMEMSFVEREDVMALNEKILIELVTELYPEKRIQQVPFPRLSYAEAMEKYGTDRPDLREDKNDSNLLAFCWVIDFPFFEKTEEGGWTFTHNPFSLPKPEHMDQFMAGENIPDILTTQYDVVLNGFEIGGGSIRNHNPEGIRKTFEIMGYSTESIDRDFGHMIQAMSFGAPPHGGIAWGFDRFVMIMRGESNIREIIAFPKSGESRDPLMSAPSSLQPEQLKELGLKVIE
ncbi:MAG TPA: aspartate--tRNA ligase [Verrucomicrobiae bacterium]|nr:aspartate--tRNA ligase [Verrucomicrobiae bacterium]